MFLLAGLFCAMAAQAQSITVSGTVIDPEGEPLIGASVLAQGTAVGTATDLDGNFTINVAPTATLVISYVGYDPLTVPVDGRTDLGELHMAANAVMLNEVVAIGYGTVKKSDATGSVAVIKPSEVAAGLASTAQDLLVGASPGLVVASNGGDPAGGSSI